MGNTNVDRSLDEKQKRVAYALNMCTVSVSQIIDYDDINILDQEYDAILNNLNLEEMPKDDALLNILKDLLDVITHFKVSELEKQFIEREYQQKMKNAIWSAVPNFGLILAAGSPLSMTVSLANQVGIGYMNYRRNKESYGLERDRQMWHLKRAAIEQFNFIRKELFDCAWRLAKTHEFPDAYRLTEKQIKQYNSILQDQDVRRKYERLEAVKDNFEAYPPFWYFIGNAANLIANDVSLNLSETSRASFRCKALEYFEKFDGIEQKGILKEDVLSALCALEHIDLLLLEATSDKDKINMLLNKAVSRSKTAFDIQQLCAITYLKIGNADKAVEILRNLVNEDYNKIVNAQMLSAVYVHSIDKYKVDYEILATRVNPIYLFPMPDGNQNVELLESKFEATRRDIVNQQMEFIVDNLARKYAIRWNVILSTFEADKRYPDDFFSEEKRSKMKRREEAERVFRNAKLKEEYQKYLANCNFELKMRQILNEMTEALFSIQLYSESDLQEKIAEKIRREIKGKRTFIDKIRKAVSESSFQMQDYVYSQNLTLESLVSPALISLKQYGSDRINHSDLSTVAALESDLLAFCVKEGIEPPEVAIEERETNNNTAHSPALFEQELFGHQAVVDQKNADFLDSMLHFVSDKTKQMNLSNDQIEVLLRDEPKFNGYFRDAAFKGNSDIEAHAIMILHDKSRKSIFAQDVDLIFTTDGIVDVHKGKADYLTPYNEVKLKDNKLLLYHCKYNHKSVDKFALADMIHDLGTKYVKSLESYVEYIPGVVTVKILLDWFKHNREAMNSNMDRVIVIPNKENLEHFGYYVQSELNMDKNLMQCYYESATGNVLGMRIVRGEGIDSKVQSLLLDHNGMLFVGR